VAKKRSLHIWLEESEHQRLEEIAKDRGWSVAEVIRSAVRGLLAGGRVDRDAAAANLCGLALPLRPWSALEEELNNAPRG
jgi:hypothetical protein